MTIKQAKDELAGVSMWAQRLEISQQAGAALNKIGADGGEIEREGAAETARKVIEAVRKMLKCKPDEARLLLIRYVDRTPYERLSTHPEAEGISQRNAERILARAIESYAANN